MNIDSKMQRSRLGSLLVNNHTISEDQLTKALDYQKKRHIKLGTALIELHIISRRQLKFALKKQVWIRALATFLALLFAPFNHVFAENQQQHQFKISQHNKTANKQTFQNSLYINNSLLSQTYPWLNSWQPSYNQVDNQYSFNQNFTEQTGFQISFFAPYSAGDNQIEYQFEPQISLFKSSSIAIKKHYQGRESKHNRYSQPSPTTYMVTLKGRCLYENVGESSKIWSLNRADVGVQRNAELMFSVTKLF